jgi:hypothetical protein
LTDNISPRYSWNVSCNHIVSPIINRMNDFCSKATLSLLSIYTESDMSIITKLNLTAGHNEKQRVETYQMFDGLSI